MHYQALCLLFAALPGALLAAPLPSYELSIRDGHFTPASLRRKGTQ